MGEHDNNHLEEKQKKRNRILAVLLMLSLIVSLCSVVYALIQKTSAEKAQRELINCLQKQVDAREELNKKEEEVKAYELRSNKLMNALEKLSEKNMELQSKR